MPQLHIRYEGQSIDVAVEDVDLGDLSTDQDVRAAAATHLSVPATKFSGFLIDSNEETGDVTLRPQAVFG